MGASVTGTQQSSEFFVHSRAEVTVTLERVNAGSIQLLGFTDEDDAIQGAPVDDTVSYTKGMYGGVSANIDMTKLGEIILKLKGAHPDNGRLAAWHAEVKAGIVDPGTIIISSSSYRHTAKNCLPRRLAPATPSSSTDPSVEWSLLVGEIDLWQPIVSAL